MPKMFFKNVSADRVLMSSEFPTSASAAAKNAREKKTVLTCGRCRIGAEAERDTLVERYSFPNSYMDETCALLPRVSQRVTKRKFDVFLQLKLNFYRHKPAIVSFCKKFNCKLVV